MQLDLTRVVLKAKQQQSDRERCKRTKFPKDQLAIVLFGSVTVLSLIFMAFGIDDNKSSTCFCFGSCRFMRNRHIKMVHQCISIMQEELCWISKQHDVLHLKYKVEWHWDIEWTIHDKEFCCLFGCIKIQYAVSRGNGLIWKTFI